MADADTSPKPTLPERIGQLWLAYLKGQLISAASIGFLTWVVSAGVGLWAASWLGVFAGLMETLPNFGPLVALIPAVIVALWKGSSVLPVANWVFALIICGIYIAIQQIGTFVIQPRVLGKQLDLPPWAAFLSILIGGSLAGIAGMYLAVPVVVTLREIIESIVRHPGPTDTQA